LLTLGLIRFFNASFAAPRLPVPWHPLLLLNHVTLISAVCYRWEQKRPALRRSHWIGVLCGLALVNAMFVMVVVYPHWHQGQASMEIVPGAIYPAAALAAFVAVAVWVQYRGKSARQTGQALMLVGLLWLIVYDAAFVAGYASLLAAGIILLLLPIAYVCVQLMRWYSRLMTLAQRPAFKRVEV
jgi:hypothetical protein